MRTFSRPRIVVSKCLEFAPCRYDGTMISEKFVRRLKDHVMFLPVCPETEIGLGCPRDPIRIVLAGGRPRLVQPATGRDVTEAMQAFAEAFLGGLEAVDGFLLKSRSPSCGIRDVKRYGCAEDEAPQGRGSGVFGGAVLERFSEAVIEDEERLGDRAIRRRFLERLFAGEPPFEA